MTPPIDYLAFVEWPTTGGGYCQHGACMAWGDYITDPSKHRSDCRIVQRNAALQAAHAMQARVDKLAEFVSTEIARVEAKLADSTLKLSMYDYLAGRRDTYNIVRHELAKQTKEDAPAARTEKEE